MRHTELSARLSVLCVFLFSPGLRGSDLYVAPTGIGLGSGTIESPYDLVTALSGLVGQPGDTFWLRGGNYVLGQIDSQIHGAPGQPITFRQMPAEKARIDGSLTFWGRAGYVVLRDFELYSSDTNRMSSQTNAGINPPPSDINALTGIACHAANFSFINLVVHDHTRGGIYLSEISTNTVVYGCVFYNNGWASPDNAEGHSVYVQSHIGTREVADNLAFSATGANFHIYENRAGGRLAGVTLEGNVAFNAGALQSVRRYADWIVGVDAPALQADTIVLRSNMSYNPPTSPAIDLLHLGRDGTNGSVALLNNYLPLGLLMNNWTNAVVSGNLLAPPTTNPIIQLNQTLVPLAGTWEDNHYSRPETGRDFQFNSIEYGFADWKNATGFDGNSTYAVGGLSGTKVFVRPNRYEAGRANIVVYNWDNLSNVTVDVSSVLAPGSRYEVRNAQDFLAPPVLSGVFDGQPLLLPMTGLTVAVPNGPMLTPPPTGPTFNVFVLLPCQIRLGITLVADTVELTWPTHCGPYVLQVTDGSDDWADATTPPEVRGDQYVVRYAVSGTLKFYRLRSE